MLVLDAGVATPNFGGFQMSRRMLAWLLLVLVGALCSARTPRGFAADEPDDLKLLTGTWKPKEANLGDNKIDSMVLEKATVVYAGDKYTVKVGDKEEHGTFT